MKLEKFTTESGLKFIDDALGFDYLLFFHDCLRGQCTNEKIKVFANIGIMASLSKASLYRVNNVLIFSLFGRSHMILFYNHSYFLPLLQILTYRNGCISDKFKDRTVKVS